MKKLSIYISVLVLGLLSSNIVNAQRHGDHHRSAEHQRPPERREQVSYRYDRDVRYDRDFRNPHFDRQREMVYRRPMVMANHHRQREEWYYNRGFERHSGYVYFPKYRTYYDPYREGYVYQQRDSWVFAPTVPSFMVGLNLGGLSIQFLSRLPI